MGSFEDGVWFFGQSADPVFVFSLRIKVCAEWGTKSGVNKSGMTINITYIQHQNEEKMTQCVA